MTTDRPRHPARFSDEIMAVLAEMLPERGSVLDPFAGTGRIHELATDDRKTVGIEIEPEWASMHPDTLVGDATDLPFADDVFDAICTSPVYGNRMSDHFEASDDSRRITYRHSLGRPLHERNAGRMQWGGRYRVLHQQAWTEAARVLRPGGIVVLNLSDHIRKGQRMPVSDWHLQVWGDLGFWADDVVQVETPRMRFGQNHGARVEHEIVVRMSRPS